MSYIDTVLARCPPGTIKVYGGDCPRPRKEASNSKGARMSGTESPQAPTEIGHNRATFDEVARANLKRGLHLTHLEVITRAIDDPRLDMCALQVLAHIIKHMNGKSAMAYPGRERLAAEIIYHMKGEPRHYSPKVIGNAVSKLIRCDLSRLDQARTKTRGACRLALHRDLPAVSGGVVGRDRCLVQEEADRGAAGVPEARRCHHKG